MTAPHTPTLPGIEPPAPRVQALRAALMGRARHDATVRVRALDSRVQLSVVLDQCRVGDASAAPVLVTYLWPDCGTPNADAAAAHQRARRMRAGSLVLAVGQGLGTIHLHGEQLLTLHDCISVDTAPEAAAAQPREADHAHA